MRITYRTRRVLEVVAERAGRSNRVIAARAGVSDEGQVSRLLARLQGFGLVENTGRGQAGGAPNAWRLTAKGTAVERALRKRIEDTPRRARASPQPAGASQGPPIYAAPVHRG